MSKDSKIEWTHHTFNPWWGCAKVSPACAHCYAEAFAKRTGHKVWSQRDGDGERRTFTDKHWREPLSWAREAEAAGERRRVFCASMADVFERHPTNDAERPRLWELIRATPWLDWLLLTKRPENIEDCLPEDWDDGYHNVWLGATVENQRWVGRVDDLLKVRAAVHFISGEPLLGRVSLVDPGYHRLKGIKALGIHEDGSCEWDDNAARIDWVIVGGESGHGARPMDLEWARALRDECRASDTAFFFKQMGGSGHKQNWDPIPDDLMIREYPDQVTA